MISPWACHPQGGGLADASLVPYLDPVFDAVFGYAGGKLAGGLQNLGVNQETSYRITAITLLGASLVTTKPILSKGGLSNAQHLIQLKKYGSGGFKELSSGRIRYYGQTSLNKGNTNSFRMVREWNPATGGKRTWFETLNSNGGVIQVRPEFGTGVKTHYLFDGTGGYLGKW
jgi:hypothetical protein